MHTGGAGVEFDKAVARQRVRRGVAPEETENGPLPKGIHLQPLMETLQSGLLQRSEHYTLLSPPSRNLLSPPGHLSQRNAF